ncbi:hypothetical protein H9Q70_008538 [Fusarium xylarioides]|nr:hypothetical protein H9Q70_008538 [Fusarium xylarioides]
MVQAQASLALDDQLAAGSFGWLTNKGILKLNAILCLSLISSYATGYDGSMMNGLQSLDTWKASFNNPDANKLAILNAIQNIGQLAALPFCAWFCDKYGRRPGLVVGATIMLLGVGLQGGAQNTGMFIAARGILGFGLALNITAAPVLIMELAYPTQRAPMVSIYNTLWGLGALSAAWITYGTFRINSDWAWRISSILQALSSFLQLGLCFLIDESPRWLVAQEREPEAEKLLIKYHANGDSNNPAVAVEMEEIRTAIRLENDAMNSTSYLSFFKTKGNRHRFFIILAETQTLINALLTVWGLFWGVVFSLLVNRIPRRALFLFSTLGSLATYVVWTALEETYEMSTDLNEDGTGGPSGIAKGVLAMIFLFNVFFTAGWGVLQVTYVVEILPFNLRARGLVLYNLFVACALIFNQYANPIGVTNSEAIVVYFLFVETRGLSLEETALVLDGPEMGDRLVGEVLKNTEKTVQVMETEKRGSI